MKFSTQALLMIGGTFFLMKGGIGLVMAAWKLVLPLLVMSGAYYMMRKAMSPANLGGGAQDSKQKFRNDTRANDTASQNAVIEICPHCLSEVGSCPKCRKKKFF